MRDLTNNVRQDNALSIIHLFEFDMHDFDNVFVETLRFTDHDIFVEIGGNEYTPMAITFDTLKEDSSLQSDAITLSIDNVNSALSNEALASEWRNNRALIKRVIYQPQPQTVDGTTYQHGIGAQLDEYPKLDLTSDTVDNFILFSGLIDTFSATEIALSATITTQFSGWNKHYPRRTFSQNEFTTMVDAINDMIYWGRKKTT